MCIIVMGGLVARRQVRKFHNNDVLRQRREAKVLGGLGSATTLSKSSGPSLWRGRTQRFQQDGLALGTQQLSAR